MSEDSNLTNHQYDGILEYDNPLPNWWLMIFLGTIIFGFLYLVHYSIGGGQNQSQELSQEMEKFPKNLTPVFTDSELQNRWKTPESNMAGAVVYNQKCSSCHAPDGGGLIGPNLTDHFWIHGKGTRSDIVAVIAKGVVEKGMPAWETMMSQDELLQVSHFVYSLKDQKPLKPKAAEGLEVTHL